MTKRYEAIIRSASSPLEPISTDLEPRLPSLPNIRVVLFDIYGTLLVSTSGDIAASDPAMREAAIGETLEKMGWQYQGDPGEDAAAFRHIIESHHEHLKSQGIDYPEVKIDAVWRELCLDLSQRKKLSRLPTDADFARLAIEYEVVVNPVWPMPGMTRCLEKLSELGQVMGIISNAQFFTPLVFPATVGRSLGELGFDQKLRYYSYEHSCAKPGRKLYDMAASRLAEMDIDPQQVLYVGNDMRNDIWPAAEVGFRTALFAGDRRSLRMRTEDAARERYAKPDAIVTDLLQIVPMISNEVSD